MSGASRSSSLTPCRSPTPEPPIMQPDHFYGSEGIQFPPSPKSDGKTWLDPNDDPNASRGIPVFKPTMDQFRDFEAYMEKINCWGQRSGIVKVIPPKEWTESLPSIKPQLKDVKIKSPIEQIMLGNGGLFRQQNMEKRKTMSVREWVELCNQDGYRAPAVHEVGLEGRNRAPQPSAPRTRKGKKKEESQPDLGLTIPEEHSDPKPSAVPSPPGSDGPDSPRAESTPSSSARGNKGTDPPKRKDPSQKSRRVPQSREARQANLEERAAKDEEFVEAFDPETDWLPPNTLASDYTPEFCQKLERHYWRNCGLVSKAPWYGADTQGTLYTDETTVWNVGKLHSALDRLLPASSKGLPGVNTPYLYFGMWRATFAWHVEDMDLYSINYIHFGAPKFWYAVPQSKAVALEHAMRTYFPKDTSQCHQFLRHKSFLASPTTLAKSACRPNHLVQHAGEFVITYPRGYHAGFNLGINCAESVNFALDCWLEIGRTAKICQCVSDSVRINVDQLLRDRAEEAQRAEDMLGDEEAHQTKAKRSHKKKPPSADPPSEQEENRVIPTLKISAKKRKAEEKEELPKLKKIKLKPSPQKKPITLGLTLPPSSSLASSSSLKPVMLKIPRMSEPQAYPCCLCVSMDKQALLPVHNPPVNRKDACDAASNPKVWMAHELCAKIIPETWVDDFDSGNGQKSRMVFGVDAIVKDRWNLKCSACTRARPKGHGAPVQCTKGKCPKAFHVMCAANVGENNTAFTVLKEVEKEVLIVDASIQAVDVAPVQMQVDGVTYIQQQPVQERVLKVIRKLEVQILCAQHNPAVAAQKKANKLEKLRQELAALPPDSRIRIRVASGVFEVSLIRVIEETCSVEVWWNHVKREFKWGSVVFGNLDIPTPQRGQNGGDAAPIGMVEPYGSVAGSSSVPVPIYSSVTTATAEIPSGPQSQQHHAATSSTTTNTAQSNAASSSSSSLPSSSSTPAPHPTTTLPGPQPYAYAQHQPHHQSGTQIPYEYWQYAAQQMPYGYAAQTYPYQYPAYYSGATPYASGPTCNMYAYPSHMHPHVIGLPPGAQPQYRNGALQWQRPYQGPSQTNPGTPASGSGPSTAVNATSTSTVVRQPSRTPSFTQSQNLAPDGQVGYGGGTSLIHNAHSNPIATASGPPANRSVSTQPSSEKPAARMATPMQVDGTGMERENVVGNTGPGISGSGSDAANTPSDRGSSMQNPANQSSNCSPSNTPNVPNPVPSQPTTASAKIGAADLAALAQLPPEQLTEILSNNPNLREGILNALNITTILTPGGTQSYSLG